jgi:hypothetical protein
MASICHDPAGSAQVISVPVSELPSYLAQGDYVAGLEVDHATTSSGDGIHFKRITDALAAVRAGRSYSFLSSAHRILLKRSLRVK